jgi:hypothetical protein
MLPLTPRSLGLSATSQQYFFSQQISHQQPASSTFLSQQTSTSHQPPAKRTGCNLIAATCLETQGSERTQHGVKQMTGGFHRLKKKLDMYRNC